MTACAQNIQSDIRYLQAQARSTQRAQRMVFDPLTDRYSTYRESAGVWSLLEANKKPGCDISNTTLDNHTLIFNFKGFAYEGNELPSLNFTNPVEADRTLTLKPTPSSNQQKILTVYSGTGLTK